MYDYVFLCIKGFQFFVETLTRSPIPCHNEWKLNVTFNDFTALPFYGEGAEWAKSSKVVSLQQ